MTTPERREGSDRRRHPRGGRRDYDRPGFSPLVFVIDRNPDALDACEAILAKLHFAVAPVESVEKAISIMTALKPDIIVVRDGEADALRGRLSHDGPFAVNAPLVVVRQGVEPLALIQEIRNAIRSGSTAEL